MLRVHHICIMFTLHRGACWTTIQSTSHWGYAPVDGDSVFVELQFEGLPHDSTCTKAFCTWDPDALTATWSTIGFDLFIAATKSIHAFAIHSLWCYFALLFSKSFFRCFSFSVFIFIFIFFWQLHTLQSLTVRSRTSHHFFMLSIFASIIIVILIYMFFIWFGTWGKRHLQIFFKYNVHMRWSHFSITFFPLFAFASVSIDDICIAFMLSARSFWCRFFPAEMAV